MCVVVNLYYNPDKYGVSIIASIDFGSSYEFDMVLALKDAKSNVYIGQDSGCSCPIPFDDMVLSEFKSVQKHNVSQVIEDILNEKDLYDFHPGMKAEIRKFVKDVLNAF